MRVLVVAPGEKPAKREIDGSLESMQAIVGGTIQAIYPFEDFAALICNWENAHEAKDEQWLILTAKINFRFSKAYGRKGPVLTYIEHEECEVPEQPVATFY